MLRNNKNQVVAIVAVILICLTVIIGVIALANSNIYIKNLGTSLEQNGTIVNTISVSGDGKVFAKPDMAELTVTISELADTSSVALTNANTKINQIITALVAKGINADDIKTSQLSIYPEYDYSTSTYTLVGQRATVSLDVKVKQLDAQAQKASTIIDEVSKVDNVQISSISFDIEDKTTLFTQARDQAYNKAKQKADELASLSGVKLLKPVSITDATYDITPPVYANYATADMAGAKSASSTQVASGQLEVSVSLSVIWGIE